MPVPSHGAGSRQNVSFRSGQGQGIPTGRQGVTIYTVPVRCIGATKAISAPSFVVPVGCYVEISPSFDPGPNAGTVYWADKPSVAIHGPREAVTNSANPRQIDVKNLQSVWVCGADTDGIVLTIRKLGA